MQDEHPDDSTSVADSNRPVQGNSKVVSSNSSRVTREAEISSAGQQPSNVSASKSSRNESLRDSSVKKTRPS